MTSPPPLPVAFVERMRDLLGDEFAAFYQSYSHPPTQGLRVNTLKTDVMTLRHRLGWEMTPVPWCETGFLLERDQRAGKHPFHAAGLFYLQEPAAMAAAELLDVQPGHWVIDVAASPGGKSTHIASLLQGEGLLVANDPGRGRIKALGENLERWGVRNAILTNADAVDLAHAMGGEFDRVLVDAPCSGEGMFRKSPLAVREWSAEHVRGCAIRQMNLLNETCRLVRPGGLLLYCTCTFAPEENEEQIARFLASHQGWMLEAVAGIEGFSPGRSDWVTEASLASAASSGVGSGEVQAMIRIWPHRVRAEGHTFALLRAPGGKDEDRKDVRNGSIDRTTADLWQAFRHSVLPDFATDGVLVRRGEHLYLAPPVSPSLSGVSVVRPGLPLGTVRGERFEPAHALALAATAGDFAHQHPLTVDEVDCYLRGEVIRATGPRGWLGMTYGGFPLGWGKRSNDVVKNHYPRGLRI